MTPLLPPWGEDFLTVTIDGKQARVEMPLTWRTFLEQLVAQLEDHEERIEVLEP
jgi:hypothetical protein